MRRRGAFFLTFGLVLGLAALAGSALPASAAAGTYVALGDSYTSGPLILPVSATAPASCLQSAVNYPHLTASALGLSLDDVSCSGATVSDLTQSQASGVAPQFDALSASDSVVTIGIGGNDNSLFTSAAEDCAELDVIDPFNIGAPCQSKYGSQFADGIAADAPAVGAALAQVHVLAPNAQVFIVGYPDLLPQSGNCFTHLTVTSGDVAYLNGIEQDLNAMLSQEAAANGATFVDTYDPSIGHDLCQSESTRWIEPLIPDSPAAPLHPNATGEAEMAQFVEAAIG